MPTLKRKTAVKDARIDFSQTWYNSDGNTRGN